MRGACRERRGCGQADTDTGTRDAAEGGLHLVDRAGADDHELGGKPAASAHDGGLRSRLGVPLLRSGDRVPAADVARGGRAGIRLEGRRLQLGGHGHLEAHGLPRRVVPVRDDDLLLPDPARVRRQHARLCDQPGARQQRRVDRARDHGLLLVGRVHLVSRNQGSRGTRQRRPDHRHADPRRDPDPARRGVPRPGQPVRGPDDCGEPPAPVGGPRQPGAHRQQLPVVQRHGDERRARLVDAQPGKGVPEGDVPRDGPRPADLHPPGTRDQLDRAGR